jgi:hypothetical protein
MSPVTSSSTPWQRFFSQDFAEEQEEDDDEWQEEVEDKGIQQAAGGYWQSVGGGSRLQDQESDDDDDDEDGAEQEDVVEGDDNVGDVSSELLSLARNDFDEADGSENSYTNVLMAHLSRQGEGVLTRRGYQHLLGGHSQAEEDAQRLINVIHQRRAVGSLPAQGDSSERERMRLCVICYIEDRTIICWPCKCLALCEGCREAMAVRPPARSNLNTLHTSSTPITHPCPTCRTPVVGFSRIFLP